MEIVQLALVRPCADWLPATLLEFALGKALHLSKISFTLLCQSQVKRNFAPGSKDRKGLMRSRPDPCWDFGLLNLNLLITMGQVRSPLAIMHIESILLTQYQNSVSNYTINNSPKHDRYSQGGDPPDRAMCIHWSSESDFCYAGRGPWNMSTRDGHADADIRINIRIIRIYRAISDTCRIMRISASMRIGKYIRMAIPNVHQATGIWCWIFFSLY